MKRIILNLIKSKTFFALLVNTVIMLFCISVTSFSYDSSKDFYNSIFICTDHFYYSSNINFILANLVGAVQYAFPNFNCFVLFQILLSFAGFVSLTFVFADKFGKKKSLIITVVINILFGLNHYANINSSKTAALLTAAGLLMILGAIVNKKYGLPFLVGIVEAITGSFYDYKFFFIGLGFVAAFFIGDLISRKRYKLSFRKFFWYFRPFLLCFLLVSFLVVFLNNYSYSVNHSTDEASGYYRYDQLTDQISRQKFPDFQQNKQQFADAGIYNIDSYNMLKKGYYDADHNLNINALEAVLNMQNSSSENNVFTSAYDCIIDTAHHISAFDCTAIIIICFLIVAAIYISLHKFRFLFFPVLYIINGIIAGLLMRMFNYNAEYELYGIWVLMCTFLFFSFNFEQFRTHKLTAPIRFRGSYLFISVIATICLFIVYSTVFQHTANPPKDSDKPNGLITEISRHPEKYYVFDPQTSILYFSYSENYIHPLWGFRDDFSDNIDSFGYFHHEDELRKRNMSENIYDAVLTNNRIYVVDNDVTFRKERYFSKYYAETGKSAKYEQVKILDGYSIYEVVQE